jgi:hypothetical protein
MKIQVALKKEYIFAEFFGNNLKTSGSGRKNKNSYREIIGSFPAIKGE